MIYLTNNIETFGMLTIPIAIIPVVYITYINGFVF